MRRWISLLLATAMILSVFTIAPFEISAAETDAAETGYDSGTTGSCSWTLDDNGVDILDATMIQRWLVNLSTNESIGSPIG